MEDIAKFNLKSENDNFQIREINRLVVKAKKCVIIAGAGISCSAGIPDFRSSDGLHNMIQSLCPNAFYSGKDLFDAQLPRTQDSIKAFNIFIGILKELIVKARPTATHSFIKILADMNKLKRVYTQNIDNLKEEVGLKPWNFEIKNCQAPVVQLHGTLANLQCSTCTNVYSFTKNIVIFSRKLKCQVATNVKRKKTLGLNKGDNYILLDN
ncbi:DHS-like NAD/FAD-binding domain-containing protein [Gigaspora rosea]|uniref:DHS-like NAD/FAD-binding domain-containing protein n=1 Tax=Gigaspora rosea TaxID=44941 RepID=A0A397TT62_9GLOM|nr:DHS-like NAD/FAD-binding domain-containing protein [Gigaspora rosea]